MVDFASLLKAPAGQSPKPKPLYPGNYPGIVTKFETLPAPAGKNYALIIRFHLKPIAWAEGIPEEEKVAAQPGGGTLPIDLSKRQLRRDFYDTSMYRLDEFIRSIGIEPNGRSYEEVLPDCNGAQVMMEVKQYISNTTGEPGNEVGNLAGIK